MIGQTLDRYRIESKLGEGGMGVVYKALDTHLHRTVAIKVLPAEAVADPVRRQRFIQEARAASALDHPNIITIHDIAEIEGQHFIVMQYVAGKTLRELLRQGGLPLSDALRYAVQMADALAQAHARGIVHRDLKPENVMVTEQDQVKILDFGLAKLTEPVDGDEFAATQSMKPNQPARTEEGTILGTVAYMSPEQAEGKQVDARSDIFSFGSVLYEMLTGRRAFQGETKISTLSAILHKEPQSASEIERGIPSEAEKIISRCLRKDPERRIQHMGDVKLALEELKEESASGTQAQPPAARAPSRWRWAWAALLPVLLVAGFFAWQVWRAPQRAEALRAVAVTTFPGFEWYPSFSPDGNHVAFMWTGPKQDNADIYVQQIGSGSPLRLTTDPRQDYNPVWSPDGRWIAFLCGQFSSPSSRFDHVGKSELLLIPPLGGPERRLVEIQIRENFIFPPYLTWCPDSNCLVVTDSPGSGKPGALFVVSLETGDKRQLTNPQAPALGDANPAVSPDGRSLVFRRFFGFGASELYWVALGKGLTAGGEPRHLTVTALNASYPAWMPDGKEVLFSAARNLWRVAISGQGPPARLPFVGEDGLMPVVSRPQLGTRPRLVYVRSFNDLNIWRIETSAPGVPALSAPVIAISSTRVDGNAQFSPDGRRVAFESDRSGGKEIWVAEPDGSNAVQLTSMGASSTGTPRWSPDGRMIAFDSNLEGQLDIYVVPASGGKPRRLTNHRADDHVPSFSHDGRWIYFSSNRTGDDQVWKIPASGGDAAQVSPNIGVVAFESPDGAYVYYTQTLSAPSGLWRLSTVGGQPAKLVDGVLGKAFTIHRRGIYYINRPSGDARLQFFDFSTAKSTTVARNLGDSWPGLTTSPDGRTILFSRVDSSVDDLMLVENIR